MLSKFKTLLNSLLGKAVKGLSKLQKKLNEKVEEEGLISYEDLTPNNDISDTIYSAALLSALKNEKITNIAITGPYGSGKSSILRTFEKNNPQYDYLDITLASFDENIVIDKGARDAIELSILQQIFYRVKDSDIPDSRFKRIKMLTKKNQWNYTILFVLLIATGVIIFDPHLVHANKWWTDLLNPFKTSIHNVSLLSFSFGVAYIIFHSLRLLRSSRINKVNLKTGEFELSGHKESSILNRYLDEIVYFFEVTNYNTLFIEDLDRFKDPEIFTKLRELNTLLNKSKQINRKIAFVYAVRDDMFLNENRTKFFDFIIPVIPIINPSNSGDVLTKMLTEVGLAEKVSNNLINDITLYVDDLRMLKNIVNEFRIYKAKLGENLNNEKLLAIIFCKNIYPTEFSELHAGEGIIYKLFDEKKKYIDVQVKPIDEEINAITGKIEVIENNFINSTNELKLIYLSTLFIKIPAGANIIIKGNRYTLSNSQDDMTFSVIQLQNNFTYENNYRQHSLDISFKDLEEEVDLNRTYIERKTEIEIKTKNNLEDLKRKLGELKSKRHLMNNWTLKTIISIVPLTLFNENFLSKKLLVYLIRHGYIDESYYLYISYFYEGSLTKEDRDFLLSVKNHEPLDYYYKLTKIDNIIQRLQLEEFLQIEILNFSLLNFLIKNRYSYKLKFDTLIEQLSNGKQQSTDFIDLYLGAEEYSNEFLVLLCNKWRGLWNFIVQKSKYPKDKINVYLVKIIQYVEIDDLLVMNDEDLLSSYINKQSDFLLLFHDKQFYERIKQILKGLKIKFENLNDPEKSQSLFDYVYENNLYKINIDMIKVIIANKNKSIVENLSVANYTTILKSDCTHLISYVQKNLEAYIKDVFLRIDSNTKESEETLIELLNTDYLSQEIKELIIDKEETIVKEITVLETKIWKYLVSASKVEANWENLLQYWKEFSELDESLKAYLNKKENYEKLSFSQIDGNLEMKNVLIQGISEKIILCNDLSDDSYRNLLESNPYYYTDLDFKDLSPQKLDLLLAKDNIILSVENFNLLKEKFMNRQIDLIVKSIDEFIDNANKYQLDETDFYLLLSQKELTLENKIAIIKLVQNTTITQNSNLANHLFFIIEMYALKIENKLLLKLLGKLTNENDEIKLLNSQIGHLDLQEIIKALILIGGNYSLITTKNVTQFPYEEEVYKLLKSLKAKGLISKVAKGKNKLKIAY